MDAWTSAPVRRRRRWYQFSLRTMLVAMVGISVFAGLMGIRMQRARRQRGAGEAILAIGGIFTYRYEQPLWSLPTDLARPWLGNDFFDSVVMVDVDLTPADTSAGQLAIWNAIGDCPQLETAIVSYPLRFPRSRFDIGPVRRLDRLRYLTISRAQMQAGDLAPLAQLPALEELNLSYNQLDGAALADLASAPRLHTFQASYSFINDEGVAQLAKCQQLRHLELVRGTLTDRGAAELAKISGLQTLVLDGTQITDDALRHISGLPKLEALSIRETQVTDQGLAHLAASRSITTLLAERTKVTAEGLREFQKSRPSR